MRKYTADRLRKMLEGKQRALKERTWKEKVEEFNTKMYKCSEFYWKQGEMRCKSAWCKLIDKPCKYNNCPNIEK